MSLNSSSSSSSSISNSILTLDFIQMLKNVMLQDPETVGVMGKVTIGTMIDRIKTTMTKNNTLDIDKTLRTLDEMYVSKTTPLQQQEVVMCMKELCLQQLLEIAPMTALKTPEELDETLKKQINIAFEHMNADRKEWNDFQSMQGNIFPITRKGQNNHVLFMLIQHCIARGDTAQAKDLAQNITDPIYEKAMMTAESLNDVPLMDLTYLTLREEQYYNIDLSNAKNLEECIIALFESTKNHFEATQQTIASLKKFTPAEELQFIETLLQQTQTEQRLLSEFLGRTYSRLKIEKSTSSTSEGESKESAEEAALRAKIQFTRTEEDEEEANFTLRLENLKCEHFQTRGLSGVLCNKIATVLPKEKQIQALETLSRVCKSYDRSIQWLAAQRGLLTEQLEKAKATETNANSDTIMVAATSSDEKKANPDSSQSQ